MRGIGKAFFGVPVLRDVYLDARPGEVHALVGENGAGKSTLMKVLAGVYPADAGEILLEGEEVRFTHPRQAQQRGIGFIHQELNLLPDRTVAENIFVGREPGPGWKVDRRAMEDAAAELLATLQAGDAISPRSLVRRLSVAQQQLVEIASALSYRPHILIMDEPTAPLAPTEVEALFGTVRLLRERGLTVLYISHRLKEVFELSDRITVLKDGRKVGTVPTAEVDPPTLVRMMVGRDLAHYFPDRAEPGDVGEARLGLRGAGGGMVHDVDLQIRAGEIVGLAGLEGSGRTELARLLFGVAPLASGTLEVDGRPARFRSPRQAIRAGVGFITEDRKAEGLVLPLEVAPNALLALRSLGGSAARQAEDAGPGDGAGPDGDGRDGREGGGRGLVARLARRVELRGSLAREVRFLSGGNQQKVVLAKWLATRARVLIFDEPTRGIDVGAKAGIHELMRELARAGTAILMISSELPEVIGMSDRILVMRNGTIAGELPAGAAEDEIMLLATGQREGTAA
jgi:ABC-type sugar transport system ATPase subunit